MIILPAIDLLDGQVVRLRQGKIDQRTVYPDDALAYAERWEEEGGNGIHVVDLNAAFTGQPVNLSKIKQLVRSVEIPVQVGGGIRSVEAAHAMFDVGVHRVVIGTRAVEEPEFVAELARRFGGERIAVGIDSRAGKVAVKGWAETTAVDAFELAQKLDQSGVGTIIFTDIETDGMLTGPNYAALARIAAATSMQVIASGGLATMDQVRQLAVMPRLHGVIIGKALFDGTIDLAEAVAIANALTDARGAVG